MLGLIDQKAKTCPECAISHAPIPTHVLADINLKRAALQASLAGVKATLIDSREEYRLNPVDLAWTLCAGDKRTQARSQLHAWKQALRIGQETLEVLRIDACKAARDIAVLSGQASCGHMVLPDEPTGVLPDIIIGESY